MNIIVVRTRRGNATQIDLQRPGVVVAASLALISLLATVFYAGFVTAIQTGMLEPDEQILAWRSWRKQRLTIWPNKPSRQAVS